MGLESATYVDDLDSANPPGTDKKKQGDDHLRLIKSVLKTTFPRAARAFSFPAFSSETSSRSIAESEDNTVFLCDTSGGYFTLTLPTPSYAGWSISIIKTTSDADAVFLAPPSGTIRTPVGNLSFVALYPINAEMRVVWTGSYFVKVDGLGLPGESIPFYGSTAPTGYVFCYGQTLPNSSGFYPELYAVRASLVMPDLRGRVEFGKDNMGSDAGRLTSGGGGLDGDTLEAAGGADTTTLAQANFPSGSISASATMSSNRKGYSAAASAEFVQSGSGSNGLALHGNQLDQALTMSDIDLGGSGTAMSRVPPGIVCNKIMRLC